MQTSTLLPQGFESLEGFVSYWAGESNDVRWERRSRAEMPDIRQFYDAMLARAEDSLEYLGRYPLGEMPEDATRLFRLVLSLAHASVAVELHRQPRAHGSPFPHGMKIGRGPWPQGW